MDRIRVLVCSPQESVADYVRANVRAESIEVQWAPLGYRALRVAWEWCPDVALVDCKPDDRDQTCFQVEMLKRICPDIRIIVHTEESVPEDGDM